MNIGIINNFQIILALIVATSTAGLAGYIGSLMVSKKMSLMSDALAHLALPGISFALIYNFDPSIGAMISLLLGIIIIWYLEQKTKLPPETLTAILFASSLSIAFLFLPKKKTSEAILGNFSKISLKTTFISALVAIIIFLIVKAIYKKLILISLSEDLSKTNGINVNLYNFIYLICIAFTVSLSVKIVGGLLTVALTAIPAATSKNLSKNLFQYSYGSLLIGVISSFFGILASQFLGMPAGPLIVIVSMFLFIISVLLKK